MLYFLDWSTAAFAKGREQILSEDSARVYSLVLQGFPPSTMVHFSGPGEACFQFLLQISFFYVKPHIGHQKGSESYLWLGEVLVATNCSIYWLSMLPSRNYGQILPQATRH